MRVSSTFFSIAASEMSNPPPFFPPESLTAINSVEEMLLTYYDLRSAPTQAALAKMESFASSSEVEFPAK